MTSGVMMNVSSFSVVLRIWKNRFTLFAKRGMVSWK